MLDNLFWTSVEDTNAHFYISQMSLVNREATSVTGKMYFEKSKK